MNRNVILKKEEFEQEMNNFFDILFDKYVEGEVSEEYIANLLLKGMGI